MRLNEHVHALRIPFVVQMPTGPVDRFVYAFLVESSGALCLIDAGVRGAEKQILDYVRSIGRAPVDVSVIVQTHAHPDHIGATCALQNELGCEVVCHLADKAWIEDIERQKRERPVPGFDALVGGAARVQRTVTDGERIRVGDLELEVIHTPGHSPGSISLWLPRGGVLFSGDAVPLPSDMPIFEDGTQSERSVQTLAERTDVTMLLAAWDAPRTGPEVGQVLRAGLETLSRIRATVREEAKNGPDRDPMELCRAVVAHLGLPPFAANPLVARSLASYVRASK